LIPQAACVPFRPAASRYEILLITTRKGKWTIPKGIVDPGETPTETAAKEAWEEAGVRGEVEGEVIGVFHYHKWGEELRVEVFLMRVEEIADDFEDVDFRERRWLDPEDAVKLIRKRIRPVLMRAVEILDSRFG